MVLKGQRCTVRAWRSSDVDALVRHANNLEVARQLRDRFPHPYTRADANAFLRHLISAPGAVSVERPTNLAIEVDGEAGGGIGFVSGADVERFSAEIGYWLGEHYWGRGIVTEALTLVSDYAFHSFNLLRLFALPFAENGASARVLEKAGYVREGVLRSSSVKFGKPRDQYLYAKLNPAWRFE
jgi:ribosomal-protein-alanine N-acetyltransferase